MARDFDGGTTADDEITFTTAAAQNNVHALTVSAHFYPRTVGEGGAGRLLQKGAGPYFTIFTEATNRIAFLTDWSGTDGRWRVDDSSVSMNAWNQIVITYNDGDTANTPVIYLGGESKTVTTVASPTSSREADDTTFRVGNNTTSSRTFDGYLAEVAYWNRILTSAEASALGKGFSPLHFPNGLVFYAPIVGRNSPEPDIKSGITGTLVGTTNSVHPRIYYPTRTFAFSIPAAGEEPVRFTANVDSNYLGDLERDVLQQATSSTSNSISDLRRLYYGGQTGLTSATENEMVRSFLQTQTGSTASSLSDLWRAYFTQEGVPSGSDSDMRRYFYQNVGLPT